MIFYKKVVIVSMVVVFGFSASGCSQMSNEGFGVLGGAAVGGLLGNQVGKGSGRVFATVAGAAIGGIVGGRIGSKLDDYDRKLAYDAENRALYSGNRSEWRGDNGNYGYIEPSRGYRDSYSGQYCREYSHTIYISGKAQQGYGKACRRSDGSWEIMNNN